MKKFALSILFLYLAQPGSEQLKELNQLGEKLDVTLIAYKTSKVNDLTNQNQVENR